MLTPRQAEVASLVATGLSAKKVALRLGISIRTVRVHTYEIGLKLAKLYPAFRPRERIILFIREQRV